VLVLFLRFPEAILADAGIVAIPFEDDDVSVLNAKRLSIPSDLDMESNCQGRARPTSFTVFPTLRKKPAVVLPEMPQLLPMFVDSLAQQDQLIPMGWLDESCRYCTK
jgi:hypothetical protein